MHDSPVPGYCGMNNDRTEVILLSCIAAFDRICGVRIGLHFEQLEFYFLRTSSNYCVVQ